MLIVMMILKNWSNDNHHIESATLVIVVGPPPTPSLPPWAGVDYIPAGAGNMLEYMYVFRRECGGRGGGRDSRSI